MRKFLVLIVFYLLYQSCSAQSLEPLKIAEKYFGKDTVGLINYLTGETLKNFIEREEEELTEEEKQEIDSLRKMMGIVDFVDPLITAELIEQDLETAVVSVNIMEGDASEDHYLFFINSNGWKLEAHRALAMTGLQLMAIKNWDNMSPEKKEEIAVLSGDINEMEFSINTSKLLLKDDRTIINHFLKNKDRFDEFLNEVKFRIMPEKFYEPSKIELPFIIDYYKKALLISTVRKEFTRAGGIYPNVIFFTIGGILDDTGGYLYVENKNDLPKIEKSKFIIIKEIGDGWYFFKTT